MLGPGIQGWRKHNPRPQGTHFYKEIGLKEKEGAWLEGMEPETGGKGHFVQASNEQLGCVHHTVRASYLQQISVPGKVPALLLLLRKQTQKIEGQTKEPHENLETLTHYSCKSDPEQRKQS